MTTQNIPSLFELCLRNLFKDGCQSEIHDIIHDLFSDNLPLMIMKIKYNKIKPDLPYLKDITQKFILYNVCADWCPYSANLTPVWNEIIKKFIGSDYIKTETISSSNKEFDQIMNKYHIFGYPTIILANIKNNKYIMYPIHRDKTVDNIYQFVLDQMDKLTDAS